MQDTELVLWMQVLQNLRKAGTGLAFKLAGHAFEAMPGHYCKSLGVSCSQKTALS